MASHKKVNAGASLSDYKTSQRVKDSDSTLFHVQDPVDGLWGLFDTSRGLVIPCESCEHTKPVGHGFWLVKVDDLKQYLLNPLTTASTPQMQYHPRQINERFALVDDVSTTYLIDTTLKTVYGKLEPSNFAELHRGFTGVNAYIPWQGERHCCIWIHESTLTILTTSRSETVAFILDINTGENSTTKPIYRE
ncbi:MAG: hypothetical protein RL292_547 [Candidatus Parcubacteria bacterium]